MRKPCNVDPLVTQLEEPRTGEVRRRSTEPTRRQFLRRVGLTTAGLTCSDFLRYFFNFGLPHDARAFALAAGAERASRNPHYLIYWFVEGGWMGYSMFNPLDTANNVHDRLKSPSDERYRVNQYGKPGYGVYTHDNIRYGYLAEPGKDLFGDMAILSSMHTGRSHSRQRLRAHYGNYVLRPQEDREDDERTVMQAFAEVYGQPYALPNLSWHWWLSDGELNEAQYTGRKGYYHALGPIHAHTIYAGTPAKLKRLLREMVVRSQDVVNREVQRFLDTPRAFIRADENIEAVKSYHSARQIYLQLASRGKEIDRSTVNGLFSDQSLREEFAIERRDEFLTYRSVNGNKSRTKFSPNVNVQAMMTYELMRADLSCAFWIESRDIRRFDSHRTRESLWRDGKPVGQTDQTGMMKQDLWDPLHALVARLKSTPSGTDGESLFDHSTIVLTSEFGRSIHGDVDDILKSDLSDKEKEDKISSQDISQHWRVTSAAFLGGNVRGKRQFGGIGSKTLLAIPLLPNGDMDPAYHPVSGELRPDAHKNPESLIPDHGDVYATALHLADVNSHGRGRNERGPLLYIKNRRAF